LPYDLGMSLDALASLERMTLRERALEAIRRAVTSGEFRPGDHLGEVELASRLGISRGTVREALRHLQQEGLVTAGARGMLRVNALTPAEVTGLYRVRGALEALAAITIMRGAHAESAVKALNAAADRLAEPSLSFPDRVEADLGFHLRLCELSDNPMLVESWRHLEGRIRVAIMSHDASQLPTIMSRERHALIATGIAEGDEDGARRIVEEHMDVAAAVYAQPTQTGDAAV
jgi:DNA-binding GntR family transcriptional regulator